MSKNFYEKNYLKILKTYLDYLVLNLKIKFALHFLKKLRFYRTGLRRVRVASWFNE